MRSGSFGVRAVLLTSAPGEAVTPSRLQRCATSTSRLSAHSFFTRRVPERAVKSGDRRCGWRCAGVYSPSPLCRYRDVTKNTLADTPSGYVQDPRVQSGRMVSYEKPPTAETTRHSQVILEAMAMEKELAERQELRYPGYATLPIQTSKAVLLQPDPPVEALREAAETLEAERVRMEGLVGQRVPPPTSMESLVRQRLAQYREGLRAAKAEAEDPRSGSGTQSSLYRVTLHSSGEERMELMEDGSREASSRAAGEDEAEGVGAASPRARAEAYAVAIEEELAAMRGTSGRVKDCHAAPLPSLRESASTEDDGDVVVVVTPQDVHHVLYLLCLCYRRLGEYDRAEACGKRILSEDLRNVDAMECLLEIYCGLDQPRKVRELLDELDARYADPAVQAAEQAALLEMEEALLATETEPPSEEGSEAAERRTTRDPSPLRLAEAGAVPLHRAPAATPSEMALGMLADLIVEAAAERCAHDGEGATARFFLQSLRPLAEAIDPKPSSEGATAAGHSSARVQHLIEALYRILDDQCSTAKAAAAAVVAVPVDGQETEVAASAGERLHPTPRRGSGMRESEIEHFLQRVQASRVAAQKRSSPAGAAQDAKGGSSASEERHRRRGDDDHATGSRTSMGKEAEDSAEGDGLPALETPETVARRRVEAGEQITFLLVVAFLKLALQRQFYALTGQERYYHFLTLHRLYEALRHLGRLHESYGIFQQLERFYHASMHSHHRPPSGSESAAVEGFPTSEHFSQFKEAYFSYMSDRVMELTAKEASSSPSSGLHLEACQAKQGRSSVEAASSPSPLAVRLVLAGMERYPESATPWVLLALLLHLEGKFSDALLAAQRAVRLEPCHLNAVFTLANLYHHTKGCHALSIRMMDRYRLLSFLLDHGATTEEDLQGTLQEILQLSEGEEKEKGLEAVNRVEPTAAEESPLSSDHTRTAVFDDEEQEQDKDSDADVRVDRALQAFYERLLHATTYSMPVDAAPRIFATPPVLAPSNELHITEDRPALMNKPMRDRHNY